MNFPSLLRAVVGIGLTFFALDACAQQQIYTPSELNANPDAYQHRVVTVRGYITLEPEGHNLTESKELNDEFARGVDSGGKNGFNPRSYRKYCLTIANPGLMYRNRDTLKGKTLVVTGEFLADYNDYKKNHAMDFWACPLPTGIVIDMDDLKRRYPDLLRKP
jgi:hypothetical protein